MAWVRRLMEILKRKNCKRGLPEAPEPTASPPPTFKDSTQALLLASLLVEYESRRTAADNRAYVLSVFSGAQLILILQQGEKLVANVLSPYSWIAFIIVLVLASAALLKNINMVLPVRRRRRARREDRNPNSKKSQTWFWHVGQQSTSTYRMGVQALSETEQQEQIFAQITGIASMLRKRYQQAIVAGHWLKTSLSVTIAASLINQAWIPSQGVVEYVQRVLH